MMSSPDDIVLAEGTNELNVQLAPLLVPLAGSVYQVLIWHEPLTAWGNASPGMEIPLNEEIHLAPGWVNDSEVTIVGHIDLTVTYPDDTKQTLAAVLNQDEEEPPHGGRFVQFEPFISSQEGTYTIMATLSSAGQVLDSLPFELIAIAAPAVIIDTTWQPKWIGGDLGGWFVKGSITILSQSSFAGKITVAIPSGCGSLGGYPVSEPHVVIASNDIINSEQYQSLIDYNEQKLAECTDATCRHFYQLYLERIRYCTQYDGFYEYYMNRYDPEARKKNHIEGIGKGVTSKSYNLEFPAGQSTFPFAFLLRADEAVYNDEWSRIRYEVGDYRYSPEIGLYEGETLLDSRVVEDAITFTVGAIGAYPTGYSIPDTIVSGSKFWAEHTAYLPFVSQGEYILTMSLSNYPIVEGIFVDPARRHCTLSQRSFPMYGSGNYTARGHWADSGCDEVIEGVCLVQCEAVYFNRNIGWWGAYVPIPPGTYTVYSRCALRREDSECRTKSFTVLWKDVAIGQIGVV